MTRLIKNEFSVEISGDKALLKREIIEELDAEEFLRHCVQVETNLDSGRAELVRIEGDLDKFNQHKEHFQKIRETEVKEAMAQREDEQKKRKVVLG